MLNIILRGHSFDYEISHLMRLFCEKDEYVITTANREALDTVQGSFLVCEKTTNDQKIDVQVRWFNEGDLWDSFNESVESSPSIDAYVFERMVKRKILKGVHRVLSTRYESKSPWGILVGVRPVKIVHEGLDAGLDSNTIFKRLTEEYCIREDKARLLMEVADKERPVLEASDPDSFSIYISIPFCPTRCIYCSFPSNTGKKKLRYRDDYVDALIHEIKETSVGFKMRKMETLYIGGGTPTTLEAEALRRIIETVKANYQTDALKEITVEAGRPDTITLEKLETLKECGVDRICINPQSMNNETIRRIGRKHTAEDVVNVYHMARKVGFKTINMDLILGLPGEDLEAVKTTFEWIEELQPENVTVHTLALKKHAELRHQEDKNAITDEVTMNQMLEYAAEAMKKRVLSPYYMYRQKYMAGNLENVGYALKGHESIYNIQMMEEKQDILAFGAGAVSKMCFPHEDRFERVPNVKGLEEYLERIDEMIDRKLKFTR